MASVHRPRSRAQIAHRLQRSTGKLSTAAVSRMERDMEWFSGLSAQDRSWVGLIVQAGIAAFVEWYRDPSSVSPLEAEVFGAAPRALAGAISLQQTVELVRLSIEVVEENVVDVVGEQDAVPVRQAIDAYAREVAFATADVYARAAEQRGAWDARLEALVVDAVLRGESGEGFASRASALGWDDSGHVVVVTGGLPARNSGGSAIEEVRRRARDRGLDALSSVQGDRLVVVLGGMDPVGSQAAGMAGVFASGPVVIGPVVAGLAQAHLSAQAAAAGLRSAGGWPDAPRPVRADDLLPERALAGDQVARDLLVTEVFVPLAAAGSAALATLEAYFGQGCSTEATGRALFVHPNTVRYRLRRAQEATGLSAGDPRESYALRVALTLGRLGNGSATEKL
ncbi:MAG: helix-turn-helix domain-containing protein [Actinomycetota bacterium]|nr:helix-turn-helix domain-containing protein [Actinomycetota bacterium]